MADIVRYGVLGASRIARSKHVPAVAGLPNAEIVAVASRDQAKADAFAAECDIPRAYGSYEAMLADGEIDAVINTLPNSLHPAWTIEALRAGKHVLCEKPLAPTAAEARAMFDAAAEAGRWLMEGFWTQFHPQLARIRQLLDAGEIGPVRLARAELTYTIADWAADSRARADLAGGALMDAGCYCVNILRWAMDSEPVAAQGFQRTHPTAGVDATFAGMLRFDGGAVGMLAASMEAPFRVCCELIGSAGRIHTTSLFASSTVTIAVAGREPRVETFDAGGAFAAQAAHFTRCILDNTPPLLTADDALGNAAALDALRQAAATGATVAVQS